MITKVYVAGASKELSRAQAVMAALEAKGITVTSTWPTVIGSVDAPIDATPDQLRKWTRRDLVEVEEADVLLLLLPAVGVETVGAYVELGFATALQRFVMTSGPHRPIFTPALSDHHASDDIAAVTLIENVHRFMCTHLAKSESIFSWRGRHQSDQHFRNWLKAFERQ